MRTIILIILLCSPVIRSYAAGKDSLQNALQHSTDYKIKAGLSEQIANYWSDTNPDSAIYYIKNNLSFAEKTNDAPFLNEQLIRFTRFMFHLGNLDTARQVNDRYLRYFRQKNQNDGQATAYCNLGLITLFEGDGNKALGFFSNASKYCSEENKNLRVIINSEIAEIYSRQGKYNEALKLLQSTRTIVDSVNVPLDYHGVLFGIANIYAAIGDYKTALNYFLWIAERTKKLGDSSSLANCYINISASYSNLNDLAHAEQYGWLSLQLVANNNPSIVANVLTSLSDILIKQHKIEQARAILSRLDTIATQTNDPQARAWVEAGLGNILFEEKDYPGSIKHLLAALPLVEQGGDLQEMRTCYSLLYRNYEQTGDYTKAFGWLSKFSTVKDSISNESKVKELTLLQSKLENEKRDALIQKEKQRQVVIRNSLIGLTIALLIISLLVLNRQRLKHQNRQQQLLAGKQLAEQELKSATEQLDEIGKHIREKNELIEKAAHEIGVAKQEIQQLKNQSPSITAIGAVEDKASLLMLQESILLTNEDWEKFTALFEKVHPGFFSRMKLKLPSLSPAETRFIALCKLKYAPKDMAGMLGIGRDAIRQYRSRLKKKLDLTDDINFEELADTI